MFKTKYKKTVSNKQQISSAVIMSKLLTTIHTSYKTVLYLSHDILQIVRQCRFSSADLFRRALFLVNSVSTVENPKLSSVIVRPKTIL